MSDHTTPDNSGTNTAQFLAPEAHQGADNIEQPETDGVEYRGLSATYSPDDNKLRLYAVSRLDEALYQRVRAAGFVWAAKQGLFVAPTWTPGRADLLMELCGEIDDEDRTLVERAEERAERFSDYRDSRTRDANAAHAAVGQIAKRFEFGQPILVGHHSERKARKDAERIESGMRRAVAMWDTAEYWKDRAAGALAHAAYKERPDVRHRRIKTIMADKRKREKQLAEASAFLKAWQQEGLTREQAMRIAEGSYYSRCFTLAEFPRAAPASQYEGQMSLWSALDGYVISAEQARAICLRNYPATIAWAQRWIAHYDNRLAYETAMLAEQGGTVADCFAIEKGGRVLVGNLWLVVLRVNKAGGRINSVSTNRRYVPVVGIEEVSDYQAPAPEDAAAVEAVTKVAPIRNYPGEGFVHITQAQWDAIPKDYRGFKTLSATASTVRHRVRRAMGVYVLPGEKDWNKRHSYPYVFITDAKKTEPEAVRAGDVQAPSLAIPAPMPAGPRPVHQPPAPTQFDAMREQLKAGVQVVVAPQLFKTPADCGRAMVDKVVHLLKPGARLLEPSAGMGQLLALLPGVSPFPGEERQTMLDVVAVEVNRDLSEHVRRSGLADTVVWADFLACSVGELGGLFDVVMMNPPFANAVDIKHITHAYGFLKPGGSLVAICANGPRQAAALKPLAQACGGTWEDLPEGTFVEEGTTVRVAMVTLMG